MSFHRLNAYKHRRLEAVGAEISSLSISAMSKSAFQARCHRL